MAGMPDDAFHQSPSDYGWDEKQISFISSMPRYNEFSHDTQSLMWLEIAYMDREAAISERTIAIEALRSYWEERWGYSFDEFFDWAGWRGWVSP